MSRVVVVGAGIAGLVASLALARRDHAVVLVESDGAPVPARADQMWAAWRRPGTPQARHLHGFPGRIRKLLRDRLPDVLAALLANGAGELVARAPDGSREPGDEDFVVLLCRRPVFEGTLRHAVEAEPGVRVRSGGVVTGLLTSPAGGADVPAGVPRVRGVRLAGGEEVVGDVVVDASGRRTKVADWLAAVGAHRPDEESSPTGVVYYGRHFALRDGAAPGGPGTGGESTYSRGGLGYLNYALLSTDNRTFIVNFGAPAWDQELRALRHADAFMAAACSVPKLAPWVAPECAEPIGGVEAMGALQNTWRAFVVDGAPVALGLHVIGDARCHTNPSHAKGGSPWPWRTPSRWPICWTQWRTIRGSRRWRSIARWAARRGRCTNTLWRRTRRGHARGAASRPRSTRPTASSAASSGQQRRWTRWCSAPSSATSTCSVRRENSSAMPR